MLYELWELFEVCSIVLLWIASMLLPLLGVYAIGCFLLLGEEIWRNLWWENLQCFLPLGALLLWIKFQTVQVREMKKSKKKKSVCFRFQNCFSMVAPKKTGIFLDPPPLVMLVVQWATSKIPANHFITCEIYN